MINKLKLKRFGFFVFVYSDIYVTIFYWPYYL